MAFNFGAFAAGFAQSAERSILQQTQRRDEEEDYKKKLELQFEYEQKAADAAAGRSASASRRAKQEELDALAQSLSFYGLTSEQVQAALAGGKFAAEQAVNMAANLRTAGKNPSEYFRVAAAATSAEDYSNADFTETVNGMTLSLGRPEVPEITTGQGLFDWEKYTADMSPTTIYDSYADGLASISSRQLSLDPSSDAYKELDKQKDLLLEHYADFKAAEREKTGTTPTGSIFNTTTLINEETTAYKVAAQKLNVPVDIDTNMMQLIEGQEGRFYSAELEASAILEANWANTAEGNDQALINRINRMRESATRSIEEYARGTYYGETDTSYRKFVRTIQDLDINLSKGLYDVGDVVVVTTPYDGEVFIVAITNTPNYSAAARGMKLEGKNVIPIKTQPRE